MNDRYKYKKALVLRELCDDYGGVLIVNDRPDIAILSHSHGVHLGQSDLPVDKVRGIFQGLIGVSVRNRREAKEAEAKGADYLGLGAFYHSNTKKDIAKIEDKIVKEIKKSVKIPIIAIGGIDTNNVKAVMKKGVDGIALSEGLFTGDIFSNALRLVDLVNRYVSH